jgi:hypothetical protein
MNAAIKATVAYRFSDWAGRLYGRQACLNVFSGSFATINHRNPLESVLAASDYEDMRTFCDARQRPLLF